MTLHHWQMSESNERYTPEPIVDLATLTFTGNGIDLDPASNELCNLWIRAGTFYTKKDGGLNLDWFGRVWCNPPYGKLEGTNRSNVDLWAEKATQEIRRGRISELAFLIGARHMGLDGVQRLLWGNVGWPVAALMLKDRIKFWRISDNRIGTAEDTDDLEVMGAPNFNNVLIYTGPNVGRFLHVTRGHGVPLLNSGVAVDPRAEGVPARIREQFNAALGEELGGQLALGVTL